MSHLFFPTEGLTGLCGDTVRQGFSLSHCHQQLLPPLTAPLPLQPLNQPRHKHCHTLFNLGFSETTCLAYLLVLWRKYCNFIIVRDPPLYVHTA